MDTALADRTHKEFLESLGQISFERIEVAPFSIEKNGVTFGLILDSSDGEWYVELHPGNFMAFSKPWDSGTYET